MKYSIIILITVFIFQKAASQVISDYAVQLTAAVQKNPPQIILSWPAVTSSSYEVYRKLKTAVSWGSVYASLPAAATQFTDTNVVAGISYEYQVKRTFGSGNGYGYINSGIEITETDSRGKIILLVDDAFSIPLAADLSILQSDMENDGWIVLRYDVNEAAPVDSVKGIIVNVYNTDTANVKAVFIFGHVPVPYSGNIAPDGHPDHYGAWPADCYYGDMNGIWTDNIINTTTAGDPRNNNIPGDGKFDQSFIPSVLELQVGRVDFSNMPSFSSGEETLLRNYLHRDHAFRVKDFTPQYRAVVDDNFGVFGGEAFAASAYKNFAPLIGTSNIIAADYQGTLDTGSYIWSYGCGGGSFTSCGGVGVTSDFAGDSLQTIFTMLFGSYFGDWDRSDNLMRAALAQGSTLSISWSGRPHWMYHHMAMGENIGYDGLISENNTTLYSANNSMHYVHVSLLGDPTLRMHYIAPPANFTADIVNNNFAQLNWTASADSVPGYNVYRRMDSLYPFIKVNSQLINATSWMDSCLVDSGIYHYMVRAVNLQVTPSGTYFNMSTGIEDTAKVDKDIHIAASFSYIVTGDSLIITANNTSHATSYYWTFGDGGVSSDSLPSYVYTSNGIYTVKLWAFSACDADSVSQTISITTGISESGTEGGIKIYPNPSNGKFVIETGEQGKWIYMNVYSETLQKIIYKDISTNKKQEIDLNLFPEGVYYLEMIDSVGKIMMRKLVKN